MSTQPSIPPAVLLWKRLSVVIMVAVVLYVLAWAADTQLLGAQMGVATVVGKEHREMKQTYTMEKIGNVTRAVPRTIPEQYVVKLRIAGQEVEWPVEKDYFGAIEPGQQVRVRYEKRRITGSLRVLSSKGE